MSVCLFMVGEFNFVLCSTVGVDLGGFRGLQPPLFSFPSVWALPYSNISIVFALLCTLCGSRDR